MLEMEENKVIRQLVVYGVSDEDVFTVGKIMIGTKEPAKVTSIVETSPSVFEVYGEGMTGNEYLLAKIKHTNIAIYYDVS